MKVKDFKTYKCEICNHIIRNEYEVSLKCKVCNNFNWKEIKLKEV